MKATKVQLIQRKLTEEPIQAQQTINALRSTPQSTLQPNNLPMEQQNQWVIVEPPNLFEECISNDPPTDFQVKLAGRMENRTLLRRKIQKSFNTKQDITFYKKMTPADLVNLTGSLCIKGKTKKS